MDIEIHESAESLHESNRAASAISDPQGACLAALPGENHLQYAAQDLGQKFGVAYELEAKISRE
ncbi:MAG: hypothetical protein MJE77_42985 [Proteobacteria bacterium]|nr:hypothetical protein [Pseudomonadota bacterium]